MAGAGSGGSGNEVAITEEEYKTQLEEMDKQYKAVVAVINYDIYPDGFAGTKFDASQKSIFQAIVMLIGKLLAKFKAPFPKVKA